MDQFYNYHKKISDEIILKEKLGLSYETYYQFKHAKERNLKKIQLCSELRALADQDLLGGKN